MRPDESNSQERTAARPDAAPGRSEAPGSSASRRMSDQEVPLARPLATAVHQWLDGDLPEESVRRAEMARDVDFWKRIETQVDQRRHMRTPPHVINRIMESLPPSTPRVVTPWHRREFVMTPSRAVIIGAGLLAAGAGVATLLLRILL